MPHAAIIHLHLLIRTLNYVVSTHAAEEIEDDDFSLLDLETSSSRGKSSRASAPPESAKLSTSSQAAHSTARLRKQSSNSDFLANSSSSLSIVSDHQCTYCGSATVQLRHVTRSFGKGAALLVIEAIPMWSCGSCGESYFSAQKMHAIERIKTLRKSVAVKRSVAVAGFEGADDVDTQHPSPERHYH